MLRGVISKFNRGEVDEKSMARDDVERIVDSASLMENWMPQRLGPMQYRPGSEYLGSVEDNVEHYLIPFLSKGNENALLEFSAADDSEGTNTFRIWIDDALMSMTATTDTITNPSFTSDISGWTSDSDAGGGISHLSQSLGINGDGNGDWGRAYQTNTLTAGERTLEIWVGRAPAYFSIGTDGPSSNDVFDGWLNPGLHALTFTASAGDYTYTFANDKAFLCEVQSCDYHAGGVYSITAEIWWDSSTTGDVLRTVRYAQSADVMYVTSNGYELEGRARPYVIFKRRATKSWSFVLPETVDGPFDPINTTSTTLAASATTGDTTLTASTTMFKPGDVGRLYEVLHTISDELVVGRCRVIGYTSGTQVGIRVIQEFGATTASADWHPGSWNDDLPSPTSVEIFEGRMWLAGAGRIDGSVPDAYTSFDPRLEGASAAISKTIGFGAVQNVSWMLGGEQLLLGLSSEEISVSSNEFGDVLTPTNARIRRATNHGSAVMRPAIVNKVVYFAQRALKKIISMTGMSKEVVETQDITLLAPEILSPGMKRMVFVGEPEPRLWVLLTDGELRVFLFDHAENVRAWSRAVIGGGGTIVDIASIPTNAQDAVYVIVDRDGNRSLEKFANFEDAQGQSDSRHYDSHIVFSSPGTSLTGLDHLNGLTVNVWGDGIDRESVVVSGGNATVSAAWTDVVVGMRHTAKYYSNRLGGYLSGSVLTDEKRVVKLGLIMRSVALRTVKYGPSQSILHPMPEISEGRLRAPTTEPEAQIVDTIDGATEGAVDAWNIRLKNTNAYLTCQTLTGISAGGNVFVFDGAEMWMYNIPSGSYTQLSSPPVTVGSHSICEMGNQLFIAYGGGGSHKFMVYSVGSDTWETVAQPTTLQNETAIAAYDGKVYMYGGNSGAASSNNWAIYTVSTNTWSYTAYLGSPEPKREHCAAAPQTGAGAGDIYFFAGLTTANADSQQLIKYNIATNTFSDVLNTGSQAKQNSRMIAPGDGFLYDWGGRDRVGSGEPSEDANFRKFDITTPAWTVLDDGSGTRPDWGSRDFTATYDPDNNRYYRHGGSSNEGGYHLPTDLWYFDLDDEEWTEAESSLSSGGLVPAGSANALRVIDVGDADNLASLASLAVESADQSCIGYASYIDGDYLYMITEEVDSANRGLAVIDISNPSAPVQVGYLEGGANTTTIGRAIWKDGSHVYLPSFATDGSLASIDVSNPTTPVLSDELVLAYDVAAVNPEKMALVWPRLYVPWENDLHIVDVSNPGNLVLESKYVIPNASSYNQCVLETDTVLWALDTTGVLTGLSLDTPSTPTEIGTLDDSTNLSNVVDFAIVQPYLYAMQATAGNVVDLTDPTAPEHFVRYDGFSGIKSFETDGQNILYAASITGSGAFYAADQRSNEYVDYDERPFEFDGSFDTDSRIYLQAQGPATVLAITYDAEDSDNEADDAMQAVRSTNGG